MPFHMSWVWYSLLGPIISCVVLSAPRSYIAEKRVKKMVWHIGSGVLMVVFMIIGSRLVFINLETAAGVSGFFVGMGLVLGGLAIFNGTTLRGNMMLALLLFLLIVAIQGVLTIRVTSDSIGFCAELGSII